MWVVSLCHVLYGGVPWHHGGHRGITEGWGMVGFVVGGCARSGLRVQYF